jgi:hypothetical protein
MKINNGKKVSFEEETYLDRIKDISMDGRNVLEVFNHNYARWVFHKYKDIFLEIPEMVFWVDIVKNIQEGLPAINYDNNIIACKYDFAIEEMRFLHNNAGVSKIADLSNATLRKYYFFIQSFKHNFWRIDRIGLKTYEERDDKAMYSFMQDKLDPNTINIEKLIKEIKDLFFIADRLYMKHELLNFGNEIIYSDFKREYNFVFDLDYYKKPVYLQEFPKAYKSYIKVLRTCLLRLLTDRKKLLDFVEYPLPYKFIEEYINSIKVSPVKIVDSKSPEVSSSKVNLDSEIQYPRYIFSTPLSFILFNQMTKDAKTHRHISFVYRMMYEKENPQMIIAKDTVFRSWFNSIDHPVKLYSSTKTLFESKNESRLLMYKTVKELIIKDS